jgi:hypothetical protein
MTNQLSIKYFELGENWWKQIIDGCYQHHGKLVFDQGLHRGHVEPGYLAGVENASRYAVEALATQNLNLEIYKRIQAIACSHFNRSPDSGTPGQEAVGRFRPSTKSIRSTVVYNKWAVDAPASRTIHPRLLFGFLDRGLRGDALVTEYNDWKADHIKPLVPGPELDRFIRFYEEWNERLALLNQSTAVPKFERDMDQIIVDYWVPATFNFDKKTTELFDTFNAQTDVAEPEAKLRLIAKLFQDLDWHHAFEDGQGRTDLIVLSALLCKHGFNPAILDEPYFATYHTLDEWVVYLKEGMEAWKRELIRNVVLKSINEQCDFQDV